jgi:hypothetical protein
MKDRAEEFGFEIIELLAVGGILCAFIAYGLMVL